ncbi:hypothetical protein E5676_scaffold2119G00530 [Cucumis melo var. makuwa]|uniref:Uncharacterized protein n=1 Tax=Cucumis melo var. makuwa TaxID=1194695 RepID=A0A5D3BY70_CUCMM|nr:hypothetical protein E5676_scaffold2119G00530 [Cucumis melo var. makuwa]
MFCISSRLVIYLMELNAIAITLIPKRCGIERMEDFRPISLLYCDLLMSFLEDFMFGLLIAIGTPLRVSSKAASLLTGSLGFVLGQLLVRYLGLPLLSGRNKEDGRGGVKVAWVEVCLSLEEVDSEVGRSWCLRAILHKQDSLKAHVHMERLLYDAASWMEARPTEFLGPDEEWRWQLVSMELIYLWDMDQAICLYLIVRDRWISVPDRQGGFL